MAMNDRMARADRTARKKAVLLQPVADPAGWRPEEIEAGEEWVYRFSEREIAEIMDTVRAVEASGRPLLKIGVDDFPLPRTADALRGIYAELRDGLGLVQMRGLPAGEMNRLQEAIALWGIGTYFGTAMSQNAAGHMLAHVKDMGKDYDDPFTRAYQTKAVLNFHCDPCDMVALFCVHEAKSGGASRVCSSVTLYNEMLKRRPDLAEDLGADFAWTRHGEVSPGMKPWYEMPVFSFTDGFLSVRGAGSVAKKALVLPGVEPWSEKRKEAVKLFQQLADELAAELPFQLGDLQILNSHVTVHSRRAYEDWEDMARKRHLMRLWLKNDDLRPVNELIRQHYSGIELDGFVPKAPLEAEAETEAA